MNYNNEIEAIIKTMLAYKRLVPIEEDLTHALLMNDIIGAYRYQAMIDMGYSLNELDRDSINDLLESCKKYGEVVK